LAEWRSPQPPFTGANTFGVANLESPADDILHLVVGVWALAAAFRPMGMPMMAKTS